MSSKDIMSDDRLQIIVSLIYLFSVLYLIELSMAVHNIWAYLIKQGKYKTIPLLLFYILAVLLCILRIYYTIWYFSVWVN